MESAAEDEEEEPSSTSRSFDCPICLTSVSGYAQLRECGHKFCVECIEALSLVVESRQRCPLCRCSVDFNAVSVSSRGKSCSVGWNLNEIRRGAEKEAEQISALDDFLETFRDDYVYDLSGLRSIVEECLADPPPRAFSEHVLVWDASVE